MVAGLIETSAGLLYPTQKAFTHKEYYARMEHHNSLHNLSREVDPKEEDEFYPKLYFSVAGYNVLESRDGELKYMSYAEFEERYPDLIKHNDRGI
jgi:hypothetical protein